MPTAELQTELDATLNYIAELDAVNIREACKGVGSDDEALQGILCSRSKAQCKRINVAYKRKFGILLEDQIKDECSGDYLQFLKHMVASPAEADADALFAALDGIGTTERVLTEIIVTASNAQLRVIQHRYQEKFDRSLIDHISGEVDGDFRDFLVQCLKCERQEDAAPDQGLAEQQVTRLIKAAKGWGCNEAEFIDIIGKSSIAQIDLIEAGFMEAEGKSLSKLIEGEMGGDLEWAMLLRLENELDASCRLLHYAMDGIGTDEGIVSRVIGGAEKEDVQRIQARYDEKYDASLSKDLGDELAGNLKVAVAKWMDPPSMGYVSGKAHKEMDPEKLKVTLEAACVAVAEIDAVNIKEACEGFGTDDDALTDILCFRTKPQIARLNEAYKVRYGTTLLDQIKDECSGDYKVFLEKMIAGPVDADCDALNSAMGGLGTTERILSEIIVTATNAELVALKERYAEKFDKSLLDHISSEVGGDYGAFLVQCLGGQREEVLTPDDELAAQQAAQLQEAAQGWDTSDGISEGVFADIIGKASVEQIDKIEVSFVEQFEKSLKATIEGAMGGDLEWAMLLRLENPLDAECRLLRCAMDGNGTDEDTVARVIGGAEKRRIVDIHARYDEKYSRDLMADLDGELGSNLKKACIKWCQPPEFSGAVSTKFETVEEDSLPEGTATVDSPEKVGQKPNEAMMPPTPPGTALFAVTCPAGSAPDSLVAIFVLGSIFLVTVPAGATPGALFLCILPVPAEGVEAESEVLPDAWYYYPFPGAEQQGPHPASIFCQITCYLSGGTQVLAPGAADWAPLSTLLDTHPEITPNGGAEEEDEEACYI